MYVNFRGPRRIQGFLGEGFCWNNDLPFANKPQIAQLSKLLDGEKAFTSGRAQLDFWGGGWMKVKVKMFFCLVDVDVVMRGPP